MIPIENSLLYVEPLYLEAEQNSLPTLVRVIVAYENRIVMAETLEQALDAIFQPTETTPAPTIIRPLEEETITPYPPMVEVSSNLAKIIRDYLYQLNFHPSYAIPELTHEINLTF
uniref:Uncharacterized protein n=1 Tax=Desertifilum tharense IPPAS B-1220 TaxID=1781255 RepID=A0ACD5GVR3_9CYAN